MSNAKKPTDFSERLQVLSNHGQWEEILEEFDRAIDRARGNRTSLRKLTKAKANAQKLAFLKPRLAIRLPVDTNGNPVAEVTNIEGDPHICLTSLWAHFGADPDSDPFSWAVRALTEYPRQIVTWKGKVWAQHEAAKAYLSTIGYCLPEGLEQKDVA